MSNDSGLTSLGDLACLHDTRIILYYYAIRANGSRMPILCTNAYVVNLFLLKSSQTNPSSSEASYIMQANYAAGYKPMLLITEDFATVINWAVKGTNHKGWLSRFNLKRIKF